MKVLLKECWWIGVKEADSLPSLSLVPMIQSLEVSLWCLGLYERSLIIIVYSKTCACALCCITDNFVFLFISIDGIFSQPRLCAEESTLQIRRGTVEDHVPGLRCFHLRLWIPIKGEWCPFCSCTSISDPHVLGRGLSSFQQHLGCEVSYRSCF